MCGGEFGSSPSDKCYKYVPQSDSWVESGTMSTLKGKVRSGFSESWGLVMAQYGQPLEVSKNGADFELLAEYPNAGVLPDPSGRDSGCLVIIDDNQIFLAGGERQGMVNSDQAFMFNKESNSWRELQRMTVGRRYHSCGMVANSDGTGKQVVVAGGKIDRVYTDSVEIFSLETESWRQGNNAINEKGVI